MAPRPPLRRSPHRALAGDSDSDGSGGAGGAGGGRVTALVRGNYDFYHYCCDATDDRVRCCV